MSHDITALRAHLFDALEGVKNGTLDLDKARAINELGKTITDTAIGSDNLPNGITGIVRHRLVG